MSWSRKTSKRLRKPSGTGLSSIVAASGRAPSTSTVDSTGEFRQQSYSTGLSSWAEVAAWRRVCSRLANLSLRPRHHRPERTVLRPTGEASLQHDTPGVGALRID